MMKHYIDAFGKNKIFARFVASIILMPIAISIAFLGGRIFECAICITAILMAFEWANVTNGHKSIWRFIGIGYIMMFVSSMIYIRNYDLQWFFALIIIVWATDIGGYFVGILIGGPKLLPKVSPSKTWSGSIGGFLLALSVMYWATEFGLLTVQYDLWVVIYLSFFSQCGDLLQSKWKRYFNVKDSGDIIPGHGGMIDRLDSIVFASFGLFLFLV